MIVFRILGWVALLCGLVVLGYDLWRWLIDGAAFYLISAGELWFRLDRPSALLLQPAVERHTFPELWTYGVEPVWLFPASLSLIILGVVLLIVFRRRRKTVFK